MAIKITCIKKSSGFHTNPYTAIESLGWIEDGTGDTGTSTRLQMYDWVKKGGTAYVKDQYNNKAFLICAETSSGTKYVKTKPDDVRSDNLLTLPECR